MKPIASGNRPDGGKEIDWPGIHNRLEAVREGIEQRWTPGSQETRRILKARARALARPPQGEATAAEHIEIIEFALAYESYGIQSSFVREVYPLTDLRPCLAPRVRSRHRERARKIVSVIDIKKFFDLPEKGLTDLNKVIVLHAGAMTFGILADQIVGVRTVAVNDSTRASPL
jgi:purine-binding chemotaxis protein CheW